jgi:hypothetical protein
LLCKSAVVIASEMFWREFRKKLVNSNSKLLHYSSRDNTCYEIVDLLVYEGLNRKI